MGQISSDLLKRHLQHDSMPVFPLAPGFMTFLCGHAQKWEFWMRKWPTCTCTYLGCSIFFNFVPFLFLFFLSLLLQWLTFYWACFQFKKFWESFIETGKFYHAVAMCTCSCRQFCSEFFSQISEHFRAYCRFHWADHSDLDIIRKIFFLSRTWVWLMPSLVKHDDVRRETKALAHHGRLWLAWESMG